MSIDTTYRKCDCGANCDRYGKKNEPCWGPVMAWDSWQTGGETEHFCYGHIYQGHYSKEVKLP